MTRLILCAAVVGALALTGCEKNSTSAPSTNPSKPSETRKLSISRIGDQTVTVNNTDKFTIRIDRDNFNGPVDVQVLDLPAGVTVVTPNMTIPEGQDSVEVTIQASDKAQPVDKQHAKAVIRAKNQPDMKETSAVFDVTVKAK